MKEHAVIAEPPVLESRQSPEVHEAHQRMLVDGPLRSRFLRLRSGARVHIIEAGDGEPVVLLHGSNTSSLSHVPFVGGLAGIRALNIDRPGFGLSDAAAVTPDRRAAVAFVDEAVDSLGLDTFAIAGGSMGGVWALWYALARPERVRRLALLGATPLLPGTRPPLPLRAMTAPLIGELLGRLIPPSEGMVIRFMGSMGEDETIVRHPELLASLVAAGRDPVTARANLAELRSIMSPRGFRSSARFSVEELRAVSVPTLLIWGDHDPVGPVETARAVSALIPDARLELLPAGHVPWLGDPPRVSALLSSFFARTGGPRSPR